MGQTSSNQSEKHFYANEASLVALERELRTKRIFTQSISILKKLNHSKHNHTINAILINCINSEISKHKLDITALERYQLSGLDLLQWFITLLTDINNVSNENSYASVRLLCHQIFDLFSKWDITEAIIIAIWDDFSAKVSTAMNGKYGLGMRYCCDCCFLFVLCLIAECGYSNQRLNDNIQRLTLHRDTAESDTDTDTDDDENAIDQRPMYKSEFSADNSEYELDSLLSLHFLRSIQHSIDNHFGWIYLKEYLTENEMGSVLKCLSDIQSYLRTIEYSYDNDSGDDFIRNAVRDNIIDTYLNYNSQSSLIQSNIITANMANQLRNRCRRDMFDNTEMVSRLCFTLVRLTIIESINNQSLAPFTKSVISQISIQSNHRKFKANRQ